MIWDDRFRWNWKSQRKCILIFISCDKVSVKCLTFLYSAVSYTKFCVCVCVFVCRLYNWASSTEITLQIILDAGGWNLCFQAENLGLGFNGFTFVLPVEWVVYLQRGWKNLHVQFNSPAVIIPARCKNAGDIMSLNEKRINCLEKQISSDITDHFLIFLST
jgi:hypothetical protein